MFISQDCQKIFFGDIIEKKSIVRVYLRNGIKLTGRVIAVTDQIIFFNGPEPQIIYKNRVSSVIPESLLAINPVI